MRTSRRYLLSWVALSGLVALGCDEEKETEVESGPIVGVMELAISHRNEDSPPTNPLRIEVSPREIRLDGKPVVQLETGKLPAQGAKGMAIPELSQAISAAGARNGATLRLHVSTSYGVTARILHTLAEEDVDDVAFEVRKGSGADTGWLAPKRFRVARSSEEPVEFRGSAQRSWDEIAESWQQIYEGCRRDHYIQCDFMPQNIAEGGNAMIRLYARGSALRVDFRRFGGPGPEEGKVAAAGPALIEGVAAAPVPDDTEEAPPVTEAAFQWKFKAATEAVSPIVDAMRPICGSNSCGAVVEAEAGSSTMSLVSFIGAAFPNGTPAPSLHFALPE